MIGSRQQGCTRRESKDRQREREIRKTRVRGGSNDQASAGVFDCLVVFIGIL